MAKTTRKTSSQAKAKPSPEIKDPTSKPPVSPARATTPTLTGTKDDVDRGITLSPSDDPVKPHTTKEDTVSKVLTSAINNDNDNDLNDATTPSEPGPTTPHKAQGLTGTHTITQNGTKLCFSPNSARPIKQNPVAIRNGVSVQSPFLPVLGVAKPSEPKTPVATVNSANEQDSDEGPVIRSPIKRKKHTSNPSRVDKKSNTSHAMDSSSPANVSDPDKDVEAIDSPILLDSFPSKSAANLPSGKNTRFYSPEEVEALLLRPAGSSVFHHNTTDRKEAATSGQTTSNNVQGFQFPSMYPRFFDPAYFFGPQFTPNNQARPNKASARRDSTKAQDGPDYSRLLYSQMQFPTQTQFRGHPHMHILPMQYPYSINSPGTAAGSLQTNNNVSTSISGTDTMAKQGCPVPNSQAVPNAKRNNDTQDAATEKSTTHASSSSAVTKELLPSNSQPTFHKLTDEELYNPYTKNFRLRFFPPAAHPTEIEDYERLRKDVHLQVPQHYKTFIDMLVHNINGTRDIKDLHSAFFDYIDKAAEDTQHPTSNDDSDISNPEKPQQTAASNPPPPETAAGNSNTQSPNGLSPEAQQLLLTKKPAATRKGTAMSATTLGSNANVHVIVAKTKSNDMIIKVVKKSGGNNIPCYTAMVETYMKNNPTFTQDVLKVDRFTYLVDPNNLFAHFGSPTNNGYTRKILVLLHTLYGPKQFQNNNAANRARWAGAFVTFYNDPGTQAEMRYPEQAAFAGDITPQDETNCAPLSYWLTAQETVDYIVSIQPDCSTFSDVLSNNALMSLYFLPEDIPRVRAHLSPTTQGPNRNVSLGALDF